MPLLVLAGGASRRMGRDKAALAWRGEPLLSRVIARLSPVADGVWVSTRPGQELPPGPYRRVDDHRPGEGPLAGLAAGLAAIGGSGQVAVAACDYPFADPALFPALRSAAPAAFAVVPVLDGRSHPLMALWRADAADACDRALDRGARRVQHVLDEIGGVEVPAAQLGLEDPERALLNVNDREALALALRLDSSAEDPAL
ncbi:MAG TPA: NTP transferase domain-containing protein [Gemmatimonadota bacterium]|nr:NTP transferase domain-containing protein [Gemmatimonadota bacterium]